LCVVFLVYVNRYWLVFEQIMKHQLKVFCKTKCKFFAFEISNLTSRKTNRHFESNHSTISSDYHLDQLLFLSTREVNPSTAILITAGSMGWIWCWSIHVIGRLINVFNGTRKPQGLKFSE